MARIRKKNEPKVIEVHFRYNESVRNVYKRVLYYLDDNKVTLRTFKKYFPNYPDIFSTNTYFWHPGSVASMRRYNERKRYDEVEWWLEENGFTVEYDCNWLIGRFYLDKKYKIYKEMVKPIFDTVVAVNDLYSCTEGVKRKTKDVLKLYENILKITPYLLKLEELLETYRSYIEERDYKKYKVNIEKFTKIHKEVLMIIKELLGEDIEGGKNVKDN